MSELVANCPRCKAKEITFDLLAQILTVVHYNWQHWYETFCVCRACNRSTVFILSQKEIRYKEAIEEGLANIDFAVNQRMNVEGYEKILGTFTN